MKKNILLVLSLLSSLLMWGCAQGGSSDANNNQNQTYINNVDCVNYPQNCQNNVYNTYGFQPYTYGTSGYNNGYPYGSGGSYFYNNGVYGAGAGPFYYNNNSAYLCNCPAGTMPTYNTYGGLGCVNSGYVSGYGYAYFGYGANNNQWVNIPQVSNTVGYSNQNCYNGVVQSCLTDQPNMCGAGYTCRASGAASRLGLCVSNNSSSNGQIFR